MENHKQFLSKLCRVCGERVRLKHGYRTAKDVMEFSETLLNHYAINVELESETIYPKQLCSGCCRKLERLLAKKEVKELIPSSSFAAHCDGQCKICCEMTKPSSTLNLRNLDTAFANIGFSKLLLPPPPYKRIFMKQVFDRNVGKIITELTFTIDFDNKWTISVYGKPMTCEAFSLPDDIADNVSVFINFFKNHKVCLGISGFEDVIQNRLKIQQPFVSAEKNLAATIENSDHNTLDEDFRIIRHSNCTYLVPFDEEIPCFRCRGYIQSLKVFRSRQTLEPEAKKKRTSDSSTTNLRYLNKDELIERLQNIQTKKREATRKVAKLQAAIDADLTHNGVSSLDKEQHDAISTIITNSEKVASSQFDEDSPQWLLWQQQKAQAAKENSKGMRWHPLIIRWCLSIYFTSPAAYKQMSNKSLNFLHLPHVNTLKKYMNFTEIRTGFNPDILERLAMENDIQTMTEKDKNVLVAFDEMKIKSNLVYHKATGRLIGFTEMGDLNDEFSHFQSMVEDKGTIQRNLATHVIVYMVRGICSSLLYPFGYFASGGMTTSQLYCCTVEAIRVLTALNFKVRALVSDGAASNRKLYRLMAEDDKENFHWSKNPHNFELKLFFFSDVPHLLKTTRNCMENSLWNKNSRNMHLDGQDITWQHIVDVYEEDLGIKGKSRDFLLKTQSPGLRKLHKLTEEHIKLTSRSRMTVKLAAQVLSQTMANALKAQGRHDTKSTIKFIDIIDRVFDCLNVSKINRGRNSKKELAVYESPSEWRFEFLKTDFLVGFLERWEKQVEAKKHLSAEAMRRQLLSVQTRDGWKLTVSSFVMLAKELLELPDVNFILSEKFSQDPLEEHFGRQRRMGGTSENPNLLEFGRQENSLNVMSSELMRDIRGNARGADRESSKIDITDTRRLPTKRP